MIGKIDKFDVNSNNSIKSGMMRDDTNIDNDDELLQQLDRLNTDNTDVTELSKVKCEMPPNSPIMAGKIKPKHTSNIEKSPKNTSGSLRNIKP